MVVLDCSVLSEMQCDSEKGRAARSLIYKNEKLIAPMLLQVEVCSVIRKLALRNELPTNEPLAFAAEAIDMIDEFVPMEELYQEALSESIRLRHSVYDVFYLVLARRTHATLFTFDARLRELCIENGVECLDEIEWPYDDADEADEAARDGEDEGSQAE